MQKLDHHEINISLIKQVLYFFLLTVDISAMRVLKSTMSKKFPAATVMSQIAWAIDFTSGPT